MSSFFERIRIKTTAYGLLRGPFKRVTPESLGRDLALHLDTLKKETDGHMGVFGAFLGPYRDQKKIAKEKNICIALIRLGADLRTPQVMEKAFELKNREVLQEIFKHPYALDLPVNAQKDTLLTGLCTDFYVDLALDVLKAGASVHAQNANGHTVLSIFAKHAPRDKKHQELFDEVMLRGAKIDHQDKDGCTPLCLAGENYNEKAFALLLRHGADPLIEDNKGLNIILKLNRMRWPGAQDCLQMIEREEKELSDKRQEAFNAVAQGLPVSETEITAPDISISAQKTTLKI